MEMKCRLEVGLINVNSVTYKVYVRINWLGITVTKQLSEKRRIYRKDKSPTNITKFEYLKTEDWRRSHFLYIQIVHNGIKRE